MNEGAIDDLFNHARTLGYKDSRDNFINLIHTDQRAFNDMFSYARSKGFNEDEDSFSVLIGKKKGGLGKPAPGSEAGPSGGVKLPSRLTGQQVKTYLGKYGASFTDAEYDQIAQQAAGKSLDEAMRIAKGIVTPQPKVQFAPMAPVAQPEEQAAPAQPEFNLGTFVAEEVQRPKTQAELNALRDSQFKTQRDVLAGAFDTSTDVTKDLYKERIGKNLLGIQNLADEVTSGRVKEINLGPLGTFDLEELEKETGIFSNLKNNPDKLYQAIVSHVTSNNAASKRISEKDVLPVIDNYTEINSIRKQSDENIQRINSELEFLSQFPNTDQTVVADLQSQLKKERAIQTMVAPTVNALYDELSYAEKAPHVAKSFAIPFVDIYSSVLSSVGEELSLINKTMPGIVSAPQLANAMMFNVEAEKAKSKALKMKEDLQYKELSDQNILDGLNLMNASRALGSGISSMGAVAVGGIAGGGAGAAMVGFNLVYGDAVKEGRKSGLSETEAQIYGAIQGVVSGTLESMGFKGVSNAINNAATRKSIVATIKSMVAEGAPKEKIIKTIADKTVRTGISFFQGAAPEALTEMAQTGAEFGVKAAFNELAIDQESGEKGFELPTLEEGFKQIGEAGIIGAVMGGFAPSVKALSLSKSNEYKDLASKVVRGDVTQESLQENVKLLLNTGQITQEQAQDLSQNIDIAVAAKNSLPKYIKDKPAKERGVALIMERNKIKEEMATADPDLQGGYKTRLSQIQAELQTISDNKWKQPVDPVITSTIAGFETANTSLSSHPEPDTAARVFIETMNADRGMLAIISNAMNSGRQIAMAVLERGAASLNELADSFENAPMQTDAIKEAAKSAREMANRMSTYSAKAESVTNGTIPALNMPQIIGRIAAGADPGDMDFMEDTPADVMASVANTFSDIMDGKDVSERDAAKVADFLYAKYKQLTDLRTKLKEKADAETNPTKKERFTKAIASVNEVMAQMNSDIDVAVKYQQEKALRDEQMGTRTQPVVSPLSGPKAEEAPAGQPQQAQEYDPANEQEVVDDFNSKNEDQLLPGVVRAMNAVAKLLAKIAPEVKFYVHTTTQDFVSALEADGMSKSSAKNSSGDTGRYISFRGKAMSVHINLEAVNREAIEKGEASRAIYHEAAHVILNKFFGSNPGVIKDMLSAVTKVIPKGVSKKIDEFITSYEGDTDEVINEERIVELVEILASTEQQLDDTTISKIIKVINDFIQYAAKVVAPLNTDISKFLIKDSRADFIDFVNSMARSTASGIQEISPETTKRIQKRYAVQEQAKPVENPALLNEEVTAKALVEIGIYGDEDQRGKFYSFIDEFYPDGISYEELSNEYHKAKRDGSNPELVKAVEKLITESQVSTKASKAKSEGKEEEFRLADVLFTTATARNISEETKTLVDFTSKFDSIIKGLSKQLWYDVQDSDVAAVEKISSGILDSYKRIITSLADRLGIKYLTGNYFLGSWEGSFEPSMNISFKITDDTNTAALSELFNSLSEQTSQDAYIVETVAKQDEEFKKTGKVVLFTELEDGTSIYPQVRVEFNKNLSLKQKADLAKILNDSGFGAFSIGDNFVKMSSFAGTEQDYTQERDSFESAITNSNLSELYNQTSEQIRQSAYIEGKKDGDKRKYNRSDVFEAFKPSKQSTQGRAAEQVAQAGEAAGRGEQGVPQQKEVAKAGNRLFNNPLREVFDIANAYFQKAFGRPRPEYTGSTKLDKERAKRISDAFIKMKHDPTNPAVRKAYKAMAKETLDQYRAMLDAGYNTEINNEEPYANSQDMIDDLRNNKRMKIFSTESGFGDEPITDKQRRDNPLLEDSGFKDVNGQKMLVNDVFRAVHDFFGHSELGNSFGPKGEENAWNVHSRMYSPEARKAMTTETRGQNSFVNFSGVNDEIENIRDQARALRDQGREDEAQELVNQIYNLAKFADQKVGLLPDEFSTIDEADTGDVGKPGIETKASKSSLANDGTGVVLSGNETLEKGENASTVSIKKGDYIDDYSTDDIQSSTHAPNSRVVSLASNLAYGKITYTKDKEKITLELPYKNLTQFNKLKSLRDQYRAVQGASKAANEQKQKLKSEINKLAKTIISDFTDLMTQNLLALYDTLTPDFIKNSKEWYIGANRMAGAIGKKYKMSIEQVSGVIAVLSPQNDWFNNVSVAERTIEIMSNYADTKITQDIVDKAVAYNTKKGKEPNDFAKLLLEFFKENGEMSINDMDAIGDGESQALILRAIDQAIHSPKVAMTDPTGKFVGYDKTPVRWNSSDEISKAILIYKNGDIKSINENLGNGNKVRNFYNNIVDPNSETPYVTADTHALSAALNSPISANDAGGLGLFNGSLEPLYAMVKGAYINAAKIAGVMPREMQSITWEAQRIGINNKNRTEEAKNKIFDYLKESRQNKQTPYERATELIARNRSTNPGWGESRGVETQKSSDEIRSDVKARADSRISSLSDLRGRSKRGVGKPSSEMGGRVAEGKADTEGKPGIETKASKARAKIEPKYDPDNINQGKPQLDLQTRIYDAAAQAWEVAKTKAKYEQGPMISSAVLDETGLDLGDIELATLIKDLILGKRPEYKRSDTGKYERIGTRKDRSAVLTRVIAALEQMVTDRRVNKSIMSSLLKAVKGDTTYTVENQTEVEMIVDAIFSSVNGIADVETGNALLALAMNAKGGIRAFMFGRIANEAWDKARETKDLDLRQAYRDLGNAALNTLSTEATDAGRFNSIIYRLQQTNPEFIVEFEAMKIRNQTEQGISDANKKKDKVNEMAKDLNNAQTQAAQQAAQAPSVQAAVNAATGGPSTQPQTPPAQKSKPQKQAQQQTNTSSPKPNAQVDNRIKELNGLLKNKFGGIQSKAARTAPAGLDPDILDIITELAENYIKKGITDPTALIAKVNADVVAAGGSLSSAYYNQMWSNVSTAATAMQNDMNASSLAGRIVGRVKQRVRPTPKSFDPIAELIDELLNKATEDLDPLPKKTPESRLDKLTRLISQYYDAKDMWEASKAKVEQRIDDLDPMKFSAADKQAMNDMLDKFFANDLSYFEIKKTPTAGSAATVDKMIREQMKEKKLAIEKILLEANTKQAQTKDEFIDQIVADIVAATGITSSRATAIARSFADQYDKIVTKKQESVLKQRLPLSKTFEKFKRKSNAQRAFEAIKYGMIDPSIQIYDKAGNIIDTTKLFCEMFDIPYLDNETRDALTMFAEAIAETPPGILRQQVLNDMAMFMKMHQYKTQGSIGDRFLAQTYANLLTSTDTMVKAFNSNIIMYNFEFATQAVRSAAKGDFRMIPLLTRAYYGKKGVGKIWTETATKEMTDPDGFKINPGEDYYKLKDGSFISLANPKVAALSGHYEGLLRYSMGINQARAVLNNIVMAENFTNNVTGEVYRKYAKTKVGRTWGEYVTLAQRGLGALDALTTAAATNARFGDLLFDAIKYYAKKEGQKVSGREISDIVNLVQGTKPLIQLDALNMAILEMEQKFGAPVNLKDKAKKALLLSRAEEIVKDKMKDRIQQAVTTYPWLSELDQGQVADMMDMSYEVATKIGMMGTPPGTGGVLSSMLGFMGRYVRFSNIQYGTFTNAPVNAAMFILQGNTPIGALITGVRLIKSQRGFALGGETAENLYKQSGIRTKMYGKSVVDQPIFGQKFSFTWNLEKQDMLTRFALIQGPVIAATYMAGNAVVAALASSFGDDEEEKERLINDGIKAIGKIDQKERILRFFGDKLSSDPKKREGVWKSIPVYATGAMYGYSGGGYGKMQSMKAMYGIEPYTVYAYGKKILSYRDNPVLGAMFMQMAASTDAMLFTENAELGGTQHGLIMASVYSQLNLVRDQSNLRSISELFEFAAGQRAYEGIDGFEERAKMYLSKTAGNIINNAVMPAELKNLNQDVNAILGNYMDDPKEFLDFVVYRWPIISSAVIEGDKTGPFGYPLKTQPKRVFPIGLEQFKMPLMLNGSLNIPTVDELLSTEDATYTNLFIRNDNDTFLNPKINGYYKVDDYGDYVRETFTLEQRKQIREEYKILMREFAEQNIDVNTPFDFKINLSMFLSFYEDVGYQRYIINKVLGPDAKSIVIDGGDALINMGVDEMLFQKIESGMKQFEPRE
jgi:hypothetical protein